MKTNNTTVSYFVATLTLIFITLKLTDYIDWSWWLVLGPLWMPTAFVISVILPAWVIYTVVVEKRKIKEKLEKDTEDHLEALEGIDMNSKKH